MGAGCMVDGGGWPGGIIPRCLISGVGAEGRLGVEGEGGKSKEQERQPWGGGAPRRKKKTPNGKRDRTEKDGQSDRRYTPRRSHKCTSLTCTRFCSHDFQS